MVFDVSPLQRALDKVKGLIVMLAKNNLNDDRDFIEKNLTPFLADDRLKDRQIATILDVLNYVLELGSYGRGGHLQDMTIIALYTAMRDRHLKWLLAEEKAAKAAYALQLISDLAAKYADSSPDLMAISAAITQITNGNPVVEIDVTPKPEPKPRDPNICDDGGSHEVYTMESGSTQCKKCGRVIDFKPIKLSKKP